MYFGQQSLDLSCMAESEFLSMLPFVIMAGIVGLTFVWIILVSCYTIIYERWKSIKRKKDWKTFLTDNSRFPTIKWKEHVTHNQEEGRSEVCVICLEDFGEETLVKVLPCHHIFHVECIDKWFYSLSENKDPFCPVCRVKHPLKPTASHA